MHRSVRILRFASFAAALVLTLPAALRASPTVDNGCGIFVSATQGTDNGTCGLDPSSPCASVQQGVDRAVIEGLTCVFVQAGTYNGSLVIPAGTMRIQGGYDSDWNYDQRFVIGHQVFINGGFDAGADQYIGVRVSLAADLTIANLYLAGANASGTSGGAARSAYTVHSANAVLTMDEVTVTAGNGANGLAGASGTNATQVSAGNGGIGGNAVQRSTACDATSRGAAGPAGVNPLNAALNGGQGGAGGTMDTSCPFSLNATAGLVGQSAATFTMGGSGYRGNGGPPCGSGTGGMSGASSDGPGGTGAGAPGGSVPGLYWIPGNGAAGSLGSNGTGGGGGGGSGGCDTGIDSYGAGGGGGGAGGVRAPVAGAGGGGAGGSFCVFAINSTVNLTNCELHMGTGGTGGAGGSGGLGQPGGLGGNGGAGDGDSQAGGRGGDGATGGHSGGGGGGAGGRVHAVYACAGTFNSSGLVLLGGTAGTGGAGGVGPGGNSGQTGASGTFAPIDVVSCAPAPPLAALTTGVSAVPARGVSTLALQGSPACDPTPCLTVDVPAAGERFTLSFAGAVPNPSSGRARFFFTLPEAAHARLRVFDASGRQRGIVEPGTLGAGRHVIEWDGREDGGARAGAGIYFARFEALGRTFVRRFTLVR